MYNFTVPMALLDFVPVFFFGVTAVTLMNDLPNKMSKGLYVMFAAGSVNMFLAGFCKALWKLLYAANICNFVALETMFLSTHSMGLMMAGMGILFMATTKGRNAMLSAAPVAITSGAPFIAMMVIGLGGICTGLSMVAAKMKQKKSIALFVLSFILSLAMGYMSSKDSTFAWVNWVEESINTASQLCLMLGVLSLHKAGLKNWTWEVAVK